MTTGRTTAQGATHSELIHTGGLRDTITSTAIAHSCCDRDGVPFRRNDAPTTRHGGRPFAYFGTVKRVKCIDSGFLRRGKYVGP